MDWTIKKCNDFYIPRVERWILDTFNFNYEYGALYQMILNKGYVTWTQDWIADVFKISKSKVKRILKDLIDREIILSISMNTSDNGVRLRNIYIPLYDANGRLPEEQIKLLIAQGKRKVKLEYSDRKSYKKK